MLLSQGSLTIFWSNALVGSIMSLGMLLLFWPLVGPLLSTLRGRTNPAVEQE
jgi:putative tricarboxylic transport membrane protein